MKQRQEALDESLGLRHLGGSEGFLALQPCQPGRSGPPGSQDLKHLSLLAQPLGDIARESKHKVDPHVGRLPVHPTKRNQTLLSLDHRHVGLRGQGEGSWYGKRGR